MNTDEKKGKRKLEDLNYAWNSLQKRIRKTPDLRLLKRLRTNPFVTGFAFWGLTPLST